MKAEDMIIIGKSEVILQLHFKIDQEKFKKRHGDNIGMITAAYNMQKSYTK